mmetsp:Transcript_55890/g.148941  ORF Transcript_55890/g.148941 Transcript_55890/m.148941 type:complete len:217 (-) Transcript_55890:2034-2684(-)
MVTRNQNWRDVGSTMGPLRRQLIVVDVECVTQDVSRVGDLAGRAGLRSEALAALDRRYSHSERVLKIGHQLADLRAARVILSLCWGRGGAVDDVGVLPLCLAIAFRIARGAAKLGLDLLHHLRTLGHSGVHVLIHRLPLRKKLAGVRHAIVVVINVPSRSPHRGPDRKLVLDLGPGHELRNAGHKSIELLRELLVVQAVDNLQVRRLHSHTAIGAG